MFSDPIPTTIRRPASFFTLSFTPSAAGLVPLELAVALLGMKSAAGTATVETPVEVFDADDADAKFGKGSELALMCRKAFSQAAKQGTCPRVFGVPIAEPGAGTAHVKTLTVTGPATADGTLVVRIAGRTIAVGVTNGDAQNTIAAALELAIDGAVNAGELPVTAAVALNVVSCTHVTKGENGGDVAYEVVQAPAGVAVALGNSAVGAGVVDLTNALDSLVDRMYDGIAVANHKAADITDIKAHTAVMISATEKKWRHVFVGKRSTVADANTAGTSANDKTVLVVACEDIPNLPGEIAAAAAVKAFGTSRPNANYDGDELDLYPPPAAKAYTNSEIESLLASGVTPLVPTDEGDGVKIVRLVTTKTTTNSAPDDTQTDLAYSRTAFYLARQIDVGFTLAFQGPSVPEESKLNTAANRARIRDMILEKLRAAQAVDYIQNVEELKDQVIVAEAPTPAYRALADIPYNVVGPLHQLSARIQQLL